MLLPWGKGRTETSRGQSWILDLFSELFANSSLHTSLSMKDYSFPIMKEISKWRSFLILLWCILRMCYFKLFLKTNTIEHSKLKVFEFQRFTYTYYTWINLEDSKCIFKYKPSWYKESHICKSVWSCGTYIRWNIAQP